MITNKRAWGDAEWAGLGHLAQEFLNDLADDYAEHGKAFVRRLRTDHPQTYIKVLLLLSPLDECMYEQVFGVLTPDQRRAFFEEFLKMPQEEQAAAPAAAES